MAKRKAKIAIDPIVRQIVNRCHVGDSNRKVIRYFISRLKSGYRTYTAMPRKQRKLALAMVIEVHRENRELYQYVMR